MIHFLSDIQTHQQGYDSEGTGTADSGLAASSRKGWVEGEKKEKKEVVGAEAKWDQSKKKSCIFCTIG